MKKPVIALASLLLIGAGLVTSWQLSRDTEPRAEDEELTSRSQERRVERSSESSRLAKLTDSSIRWQVRADMLRRIKVDSLSRDDIETLYTLLNHQPEVSDQKSWWVVVNEIMEQMRIQGIGSDRYTEALLSIIQSPDAHEILRDYAVQHLGMWVTPRGKKLGHPSETDPVLVKRTTETFGRIVTDSSLGHTSIPGTTLMTLVDMRGELSGDGVPPEILNPTLDQLSPWLAGVISGKTNVSKTTRITAINATGMLVRKEHSQIIRRLAASEGTAASIRLNSIAALGHLGEEQDIAPLQALASGSSKYRFAAQTALKKLTVNLNK